MNINNMSQQSRRGTAIFALRLHTIRFPLALIAIALMFGASYLAAQSIELEYPGFMPASLLRWVDLNEEAVPPAWFSALLWQLAALLAYAVFLEHESQGYPHRTYWLSMVPLFLFLSLDETVGVHEKIGSAIESHFVFTGFLFYAWVIFGIAFVMVIGGLYVRFLWTLRRTLSALFFASASLFLSGALVVEMIGAAVESGALSAFPLGQSWTQMIAVEEVLEMAGVILLIHTLLRILALKEPPYRCRGEITVAPGCAAESFNGKFRDAVL